MNPDSPFLVLQEDAPQASGQPPGQDRDPGRDAAASSEPGGSERLCDARQTLRYARDLARLYKLEKEREEDLAAGAEMQRRFLTPNEKVLRTLASHGVNAGLHNQAPQGVTGDFFAVRDTEDGVGFFLGDACGHGLAAALVSMRISSLIQTAPYASQPGLFLGRINQDLHGLRMRDAFVAACYVFIQGRRITVANAGQPFPLVLSAPPGGQDASVGFVREVAAAGMPLGLSTHAVYRETTVTLAPGERLVCFTDGVTEAADPQDAIYGLERMTGLLIRCAALAPGLLVNALLEDLLTFVGYGVVDDDLSLAVLEPGYAVQEHSTVRRFAIQGDEASRQRLFDEVADALTQRLDPEQVDETEQDLFLLAVVEAVNNAAEHGNQNDDTLPIQADLAVFPTVALFRVKDVGPGFTPVFPDLAAVTASRGRGLGMMRLNADAVLFNIPANETFLIKGGTRMRHDTHHVNATIHVLPGGVTLISELAFGDQKKHVAMGLGELLDDVRPDEMAILIDLRGIKVITSLGWGAIFARLEDPALRNLTLFNANEAIIRAAEQMAIGARGGVYDKLVVHGGCAGALEVMAALLETAAPSQ